MKKIFLIVLLFFSSCGYNSIYVNKNLKNLEFYEIALEGDARINKIIISSLSLKKDVLNDNLNKLFLRTNYRIDETSKNSKGKVKTYRSVIIVEVDISKNNKILNSKKIEKNFSYNNVSNKYELVEYQNKIKTDLIDGILEEIILFLNLG
jgi:hypothetical protein